MSENNKEDENSTGETVTVNEPVISATAAIPPEPARESSSRSAFVLLLDVLVLIAIVVLGYGYWQQKRALDSLSAQHAVLGEQITNSRGQFSSIQDSQQQMDTRLQTMQQQLQETVQEQQQNQQQSQQELQTQLGESNSRIAGLAAQLNAVNGELANTRQQVNMLGSKTADDVMLSEAQSLIELAQQRLTTASDVKSATTLLLGSDDLLSRIASIDVTAARTVLAADLINLRALPEVNAEALYQQLAQVSSQVKNMTVVSGSDNPEFAVPQSDNVATEEAGWFDSALSVLGEYFVVTRQDVEVDPLLTAEQQFMLRQNIELQLTSAQLAVLNSDPEVYRAALIAAREGVSQWLQSTDDSKADVITALERLEATPIVVTMPDISASLNAIRQIAATKPVALPATLPAIVTPEVAQ